MMRARTSGRTHIRISNRRLAIAVPVLGVLLIAAMIVATGFGAETLPVTSVLEVLRHRIVGGVPADLGLDTIVWQLRVPRTVPFI